MTQLDSIDRAIIVATQDGLPLVPRPYDAVAEQVGIAAAEVTARMVAMIEAGVIRRIGAVPNHYALGYRWNGMSVWDVADGDVAAAGAAMTALGFVSHCYQRPRLLPHWPYSLFAMVHARNQDDAELLVRRIAQALGPMNRGHRVLYSTRILKKTGLRLTT
ncbi:AsnC family transcriptional regulator [Magnetospirillum sulfuroxidans]|uniref:siroheme decarboxylase n=1 Tax=Magnetospirillum sulfuroxidans TaxID=611300 RepID=A0ABS5IB07_9PROT|nr:AsnC family transcriptional regulator [Magnetospirillum sulfuroxidans]MBR9971617.1 AsnC family transcriptional regulator [Magnetospirillum sulfuroxidans]